VVYQHIDLTAGARRTGLAAALAALEDEFGLPRGFPEDVLAEARAAVAAHRRPAADRTGIPFVTIDPPGSTDLDQAVHLSRDGGGYTVHYAIADVPAFVAEGGAVDREARLRGQTVYLPHRRIPLHPEVISEDAGSLLPNRRRGAYVWTFRLDPEARVVSTALVRAAVVSRARLTYAEAQEALDAGTADEPLSLLKEVGLKRVALEHARGGAHLRIPEQEIEADDDGGYRLVARAPLPVEDWNAQISLLTGMEAARIMVAGRVGILRTLPEPEGTGVAYFRRRARALGREWEAGVHYGDFLRSLDLADPRQLALMHHAAALFRGAGYTAFDGEVPAEHVQAAIAAPYAHATAPLRRLVDRFVLVVCDHLLRGEPVPSGVRQALPLLPELMQRSGQLASRVERAAIDTVEAALLAGRIGGLFSAVVIEPPAPAGPERNGRGGPEGNGGNGKPAGNGGGPYGTLQIADPPVSARFEDTGPEGARVEAGEQVTVQLAEADPATRKVLFRTVR